MSWFLWGLAVWGFILLVLAGVILTALMIHLVWLSGPPTKGDK